MKKEVLNYMHIILGSILSIDKMLGGFNYRKEDNNES